MTEHRRPIRIVLVDDHEMVRVGLKALLSGQPDFEVIGETGRGAEAVELVRRTQPDVALLDARLPDLPGPDVCRQLKEAFPNLKVMILTVYTDTDLLDASIKAGADGYVIKDVEQFALEESIRAVHRGETPLSPQVAGQVLDQVRRGVPDSQVARLSDRQVEILKLLAEGYSNREIANRVHLSENTVKTHLQSIFDELGVKNRVQAAIVAARAKVI
ncbi:MAG TPA: response regulator transcription factor [Candidatus Udaeobacter sp.]|nr:response regulator transcription factor [Candidatus Udaeobacter sp.]